MQYYTIQIEEENGEERARAEAQKTKQEIGTYIYEHEPRQYGKLEH